MAEILSILDSSLKLNDITTCNKYRWFSNVTNQFKNFQIDIAAMHGNMVHI